MVVCCENLYWIIQLRRNKRVGLINATDGRKPNYRRVRKRDYLDMSNKTDNCISIIVPVYNVSEYLDACIQSIIEQDYNDLEIILVDDGSMDDSLQKCREWASKDLRIRVYSQENRGLSAARNIGVALSSSKYISFIDPDDIVEPDYISVLFRTICDGNADLSTAYLDIIGSKTPPLSVEDSMVVDGDEAMDLLCAGKIPVSSCCKIYKADMLKATPFIEGLLYEDNPFTYQVIGKCRSVAICKTVLYHHRMRDGSITHTVSVKNFRDWIKAMSIVANYIEEKYSSTDIRYLSKETSIWCQADWLYRNQYAKLVNKQVRREFKAEQQKLRETVLFGIARIRVSSFPQKVQIKLLFLKYAPRLWSPFYKTYQMIKKFRGK